MAGSRQIKVERGRARNEREKENMGWQNEKLKRCDQVAVTRGGIL
jgi:hypothetical protein